MISDITNITIISLAPCIYSGCLTDTLQNASIFAHV